MVMPRQGLNTETVVKTAALLIEENGYESLTLHKLASKLNVKPASLYTHIQGIDELYVSLADMALKQLSSMMLDAAKGKKRGDALRAVATAYCEYVKQNPEMYRIIMKIPHSNSEELIKTGRAVKSILFDVLSQYTKENDIKINFVKIDSLEKAKNVPCIFNNWANFYKGEFVSNTILNANSFEKLIKS